MTILTPYSASGPLAPTSPLDPLDPLDPFSAAFRLPFFSKPRSAHHVHSESSGSFQPPLNFIRSSASACSTGNATRPCGISSSILVSFAIVLMNFQPIRPINPIKAPEPKHRAPAHPACRCSREQTRTRGCCSRGRRSCRGACRPRTDAARVWDTSCCRP